MQAEGEFVPLHEVAGGPRDFRALTRLSEDVRQMLRALTPRQRAAFLLLDQYDDDLEGAEP
jgi:DNA-directed RNA polymerase specialized sigma24 family protein